MTPQAAELLAALTLLLGVPLSMVLMLCVAIAAGAALDRTGT